MNIKFRTHRRVQATRVPSSLIAPTLGLCVTNRLRYDKELLSRKSHNESTFSMYSGVFKERNSMPSGGLTEIFQLVIKQIRVFYFIQVNYRVFFFLRILVPPAYFDTRTM